jgi:hypothetical protein
LALRIGTSELATAYAKLIKAYWPWGPKDYKVFPYCCKEVPLCLIDWFNLEKSKVPVYWLVAFFKWTDNSAAALLASSIFLVIPSSVFELSVNLLN